MFFQKELSYNDELYITGERQKQSLQDAYDAMGKVLDSIDADMPFGYVTEKLLSDLEYLEPYGNGNAKPVFAQREVLFLSERRFGPEGKYASYRVMDKNGTNVEMKFFGDTEAFHDYINEKYGSAVMKEFYEGKPFSLSVIYQPEINVFRGVSSVQFRLVQYK